MKFFKKHLAALSIVIILLSIIGWKIPAKTRVQNGDKYVAFLMDVYGTVKANYWEKITDEQLTEIYRLGILKIIKNDEAADIQNNVMLNLFQHPLQDEILKRVQDDKWATKNDVNSILLSVLTQTFSAIPDDQKKKEFATTLADIVLANLKPFGRSRLYSAKQESDLANTVKNTNPDVDQYQILGVSKTADEKDVQNAYESKSQALKNSADPKAKEKLAELDQAYKVLGDSSSKSIYDQTGAEPTLEWKKLTNDIFYIHWQKFSPTTLEELKAVTEKVDLTGGPTTLILDLRDNIGGIIDGLPYFLGPFVGFDRYAYRFYHQGEIADYKTKLGWMPSLVRYKTVVILINEGTQSTAEVMASTLKLFNVGVLVGTKTKGWGTIEKVFPINAQIDQNERYSAFLVHTLTVRDDGQPIESNGVEPVVDVSKPGWEKDLYAHTHYPELIAQIKDLF